MTIQKTSADDFCLCTVICLYDNTEIICTVSQKSSPLINFLLTLSKIN